MKRVLFATVCCVFFLSGCVSQSEYDTLSSEKDALATQVAELQAANDTLTAENENLKAENATLQATPEPAQESTATATDYAYIGNANSMKFHLPTCEYLPAEYNRVYYATRDEAINDGMKPCRRCSP